MAKYTKLVQNQAELTALKTSNDFITPNVTLIYDSRIIDFNPYVPHDYSQDYLTFVAEEDGTFSFNKKGIGDDIQYSVDNGETWTTLSSNTDSPTVSSGNKIMFKATLTPEQYYAIGEFSSTGRFTAQGNVMSLLYSDNFIGQVDLTGKNYAFGSLFFDCTKLMSAENLSLPATTLASYCYSIMFKGCTSLTNAPELPATTLVSYCYDGMFENCTSLTTAPELPATTLASCCYRNMFDSCTSLTIAPELHAAILSKYCYNKMFVNCKSLTTAPVLPATALADFCYKGMFQDCINLNSITCLATDISASDCTRNWVNGVAQTGTFTKAASMTVWTTGTAGIPSGWTVEDAS